MIDVTPTRGFPHTYDFVGNAVAQTINPITLVVLLSVLGIYFTIFSYLGTGHSKSVGGRTMSHSIGSSISSSIGNGNSRGKSGGIAFIEIIMWGMLIFLVLINGLQYFFNIDIRASIKNLFSPVPEIDIGLLTPDGEDLNLPNDIPVPEITYEKQVFHIPDNIYTYQDAKAVCKAYGGKLANYEQIEQSYKDGGEWCGYGWSDNQMALYPTQMKTWKDLQKIKGHEHDCGRPGINGGYIDNKNVRFGINCYGYKPKITNLEREMMDKQSPIPRTKAEHEFEKRVDHYKKLLPDILVSPFNYDNWSQI